jgi:pilus assembly protein Flp/PilA
MDRMGDACFGPSCFEPYGENQMSKVLAFLKNESGATAIEYGLIAAGISVVIIAAVTTVGNNLQTTFNAVGNALAG